MQWTFYRVLAAPKDIGLPISTACARLLILSVQVRLLIVGPASCILQGCRCDARVLARSLQGAQLGLFSAPRLQILRNFGGRVLAGRNENWEKNLNWGCFRHPGDTDLRRVQRIAVLASPTALKKCTGTDLISRNVPLVALGPKQTSPARSDQGAPRLLGIKAALDNVFAWQRRDMQQRG